MKDLPDEICYNLDAINLDAIIPYHIDDFIADCKTYIKAFKADRLIFVERCESIFDSRIFIRSYEGTMKGGYYKSYNNMLKALGFSIIDDAIKLPKDGNYDVLTKLYELGVIKEKKYKKLKEKQ